MKALLYKDILAMKKELMIIVIFLVTYSVLSIFSDGSTVYAIIGALCGAVGMLPIYTFTYDEKSRFDSFASATPLSKRTVVLSKYLLGFLGTILLCCSMAILTAAGQLPLTAPLILLFLCGTLIFSFIQVPLHFWLGANKARIITLLMFFLLYFSIITLGKDYIPADLALPDDKSMAFLAVPVTAAVFAISAYLSYKIYLRKEF